MRWRQEQRGASFSFIRGLAFLIVCLSSPSAQATDNLDDIEQIPIRGVIQASREGVISTELVTRVTQVGFKEGETFKKGDVLIKLDCRRQKAELAAARALEDEMASALRSAQYLFERRAGSREEVDISSAKAERARADAEAHETRLEQCELRAPYDGAIASREVHEHEMTTAGKPLLSIIDVDNPRIELIVPSAWLAWLETGQSFRFQVNETQGLLNGRVERFGATIDAVSQTVKVFAQIEDPPSWVRPGMSGIAEFSDLEAREVREGDRIDLNDSAH